MICDNEVANLRNPQSWNFLAEKIPVLLPNASGFQVKYAILANRSTGLLGY
jgi:hypothetical protein